MNVSEVLDIKGSHENSKKLVAGDKITIQAFKIKNVDEVGAEVAEISTTEGLRHSFGKTVIGQAKSDYWKDVVAKCVDKDAADGLDAYVVEKEAEGTGRMMLTLSMFPPKN
jgi:hypothetical protein